MNSYLIEIIKNEALPHRNCMLTIFDPNGDSGFLYFKDAQLIEVNAGKVWGVKALELLFTWQISTFAVGELPVGIKRTLWEPLDRMLEQFAGVGAAAGLMDMVRQMPDENALTPAPQMRVNDPMAAQIKKFSALPGFKAVFREEIAEVILLAGQGVDALSADWFQDFLEKVDALGASLGAGILSEWFLEFDEFRVWRFSTAGRPLIIFSDMSAMPDEFEDGCRAVLEGRK